MVTNALKETKLSATLCRLSPPSSPSRARLRSTSPPIASSSKPRSKILAALDAEIPNWLADSTSKVSLAATKNPLATTNTSYATFSMGAVTSSPDLTFGTSGAVATGAVSKGKAKATAPLPIQRTISDIENQPAVAVVTTSGDANSLNASVPPEQEGLPLYSFKQYPPAPAVVYTRHEEEANDLVGCLKGPLGFDLEWPVVFRRGRTPMERRTALVQICDSQIILLVQVSAMSKFPQKVKEVIENKDIIKLGANIRNDGQKLFRDFGLLPAGLVELGALARQADPTFSQSFNRSIVALAKVVERYTHKTLDKGKVRTSDWEAKLSQPQITYAANDAHCALVVYKTLMALAKENEREISWAECSTDLREVYQKKTAATVAAAATATVPVVATGSVPVTDAGATAQAGSSALPATASTSSTTGSSAPRINSFARRLAYASEFEPPFTTVTSQGRASRPGSSASTTLSTTQTQNGPPRPQHLRAYKMWHQSKMPLRDICAALRSKENPLAESTVISYVVRALQAGLPYDLEQLKGFVQLERGSWVWHRDWILEQDGYKK
ncbi:ribonuclease H-like protein [Lentinus tigrinus ALCF2SS1-7]|uniref:ribonuclease H-like protein n=1 Tax=Lentinus tigrinus ALCF2SS1-7 TaxID=1328758 RepID=UPI001165F3D4|nr:ribonuclease H-like protein [Lentinus tigrinus ALCF2SS1-7]